MSATTKEQPTPQTTPTKDPVDKKKVKLLVVKRKRSQKEDCTCRDYLLLLCVSSLPCVDFCLG